MYREHVAVLIGGIIVLVLRTGDLLLKWVARKLGVEEIPEHLRPPQIPPPKRDSDDTS